MGVAFFSAVQAGQDTLNKHMLCGGKTGAGPFYANKLNLRRSDSSRPICSGYSRLEEVIRGAVNMYIHASQSITVLHSVSQATEAIE